jgi:hypothetical protein
MNTAEELKFVKDIAVATGIVLDPVYRYDTFLVCVSSYLISYTLVLRKKYDIFLSVKLLLGPFPIYEEI